MRCLIDFQSGDKAAIESNFGPFEYKLMQQERVVVKGGGQANFAFRVL